MIKCGITGHTGNLGTTIIKDNKNIKFFKFKGDITNKNLVNKWVNLNEKLKTKLIVDNQVIMKVSSKYYREIDTNNLYGDITDI